MRREKGKEGREGGGEGKRKGEKGLRKGRKKKQEQEKGVEGRKVWCTVQITGKIGVCVVWI